MEETKEKGKSLSRIFDLYERQGTRDAGRAACFPRKRWINLSKYAVYAKIAINIKN